MTVSRANANGQLNAPPTARNLHADYWDSQATKFGDSWEATTDDYYLKTLEHKSLRRWLTPGGRVLDVGCGNGYTAEYLVETLRARVCGLDYSEGLLSRAVRRRDGSRRDRLQFLRGDGVFLPFRSGTFDAAVTCRAVMNLPDVDRQVRAVFEIARVVKPGGYYLCVEETVESLAGLNRLRTLLGIRPVAACHRNCLLREGEFLEAISPAFSRVAVENCSSSYYLITRLFYARLVREPKYETWIHRLASHLPNVGSWSPLKTFVLRRRP